MKLVLLCPRKIDVARSKKHSNMSVESLAMRNKNAETKKNAIF
jgi:hypothetical protein